MDLFEFSAVVPWLAELYLKIQIGFEQKGEFLGLGLILILN